LTIIISPLFKEDKTDLVMISIFFYSTLFCLIGGMVGGYFGSVMEENACAEIDMGVLSSIGAFIGAMTFGISGGALAGIVYHGGWEILWIVCFILSFIAYIFFSIYEIDIKRTISVDCYGNPVDENGDIIELDKPPWRMKNKVALILFILFVLVIVLSFEMVRGMGRDLVNSEMLAAMMYGMMGCMTGGFISGWLSGLLDEHTGTFENDNPIMISGMSLMGCMMGGMLAGCVGGMTALLCRYTIIISVIGSIIPLIVWYLFMYRGKYRLIIKDKTYLTEYLSTPEPEVITTDNDIKKMVIGIDGMTCDHCVDTISKDLKTINGVKDVNISLKDGIAEIDYIDGINDNIKDEIESLIIRLGYKVY
jgi:copper chaperone CopZ/MFS family permease